MKQHVTCSLMTYLLDMTIIYLHTDLKHLLHQTNGNAKTVTADNE